MRTERLLVRFDAETRQLLQALAERQGTSLSDAVRFAVREVAWRRGLSGHEGDLFTDQARRALQYSSDEATDRRHREIDGRHLLFGLLSVLDGRAALTLASLGVDLAAARPTCWSWAARGGVIKLSQAARRCRRLDGSPVGRMTIGQPGLC